MTSGNSVSFSIPEFLNESSQSIVGKLKKSDNQTYAWEKQVPILQKALTGRNGRIIFEYGIPGLPKVVDVIILIHDKVLVVEFKVNSENFYGQDKEQAEMYAARLKYLHSETHDKSVVPILVATEANKNSNGLEPGANLPNNDDVYDLVCCNSEELVDVVRIYAPNPEEDMNFESQHSVWEEGIFKASPTIIQTAIDLWNEKHVPSLTHNDNERNKIVRLKAESEIKEIIERSKENGRKSLVFVTGVPGAGKTLVGLNISVHAQEYGASFLSGNDPLVGVISEALRRNLNEQIQNKRLKDDEQSAFESCDKKEKTRKKTTAIESIIRGVYSYKNEIIEKRINYSDGSYSFNDKKGSQHVIIYDEAQRAWSAERMRRPGNTRKDWQTKDWPYSEPTLLLGDMNNLDWGVFICLVGGGQEINSGESGINEWLRTLIHDKKYIDFDEWDIYLSEELNSSEYLIKDTTGKNISDYIKEISDEKLIYREDLHLTECQRTPLAGELANFINKLIEGSATSNDYDKIRKRFPIRLTRQVDKLKEQLKKDQETIPSIDGNTPRIGILMSSKAYRLRPLGFEVKSVSNYLDKVANWFLDTKDKNIDSSDFLEVALTEFLVQGLEIDCAGVIWDADFRYDPKEKKWKYFIFNKNKNDWSEKKVKTTKSRTPEKEEKREKENIKIEIAQRYMQNAYRVLLTRARYALTICVPEGDPCDVTRDPDLYDSTYEYLKSLGFEEL